MQENGKILFYNEQKGSGILITEQKQKLNFDIQEWDNYEIMPSLGLLVSFKRVDDSVKNISVVSEKKEKPTKDIQKKTLIQKETVIQEKNRVKIEQTSKVKPDKTPLKKSNTPKCKNKNVEKIAEELNALLNNSSDNINSLNAKISLSMDIAETMHEYFNSLKKEINKRAGYKKVNGRLNYSLAKRFLWTTFNNLTDIDDNIVTLRISSISQDLKFMSNLKDNFDKKVKYPLTAFEDIFLSSQVEYTLVNQMTKEITERLNLLKTKEENLTFEKEKKKKEIENEKNKERKQQRIKELKTLNGTYVDIVHMMAKLQEIHKKNTKRLQEFEATYKETFYKEFQSEAKKHQKNITDILDAQAYLLDFVLWKEAKTSKDILDYFHELSIDIELNTKTYLKYYLGTLDEGKANPETKDLFKFYNYLIENQKDYILILTSDIQDALDYTQFICSTNKNLCVKSFISELESIKWAMLHSIKIIVIEDTLISTTAKQYLDYYHTHIFSKPKIILVGESSKVKSTQYSINAVLPKNVQPKALIHTLNTLLK